MGTAIMRYLRLPYYVLSNARRAEQRSSNHGVLGTAVRHRGDPLHAGTRPRAAAAAHIPIPAFDNQLRVILLLVPRRFVTTPLSMLRARPVLYIFTMVGVSLTDSLNTVRLPRIGRDQQ